MNSDQKLSDYDNPLVRKTAERLTGNTNTVLEKLDRLFHYVRDDIKFGFTKDGDLVKASTTIRRITRIMPGSAFYSVLAS